MVIRFCICFKQWEVPAVYRCWSGQNHWIVQVFIWGDSHKFRAETERFQAKAVMSPPFLSNLIKIIHANPLQCRNPCLLTQDAHALSSDSLVVSNMTLCEPHRLCWYAPKSIKLPKGKQDINVPTHFSVYLNLIWFIPRTSFPIRFTWNNKFRTFKSEDRVTLCLVYDRLVPWKTAS